MDLYGADGMSSDDSDIDVGGPVNRVPKCLGAIHLWWNILRFWII